jgi:hypothetical protein
VFGHVHVEVQRAGVLRVLPRDGRHALDDVADGAVGLAGLGVPPVPGQRAHHRVGIQRDDVRVVGKLPQHVGHRGGVGVLLRVELAVGLARAAHRAAHRLEGLLHALVAAAVAHRHRADQRTLLRRGAGSGLLRAFDVLADVALRPAVAVVDVRPERIGHAPGTHRAAGVARQRSAEHAGGFAVLEGVGQLQALREPRTGLFVAGRDLEGRAAEAGHRGDRRGRRRAVERGAG